MFSFSIKHTNKDLLPVSPDSDLTDDQADEAIEYLQTLTEANGRAVQRLIDRVPEFQENTEKLSRTLNNLVS